MIDFEGDTCVISSLVSQPETQVRLSTQALVQTSEFHKDNVSFLNEHLALKVKDKSLSNITFKLCHGRCWYSKEQSLVRPFVPCIGYLIYISSKDGAVATWV